jgi:PAS domain S-box-containing protein
MNITNVFQLQLKTLIPCAMVLSVLLTIYVSFVGSQKVILARVERIQKIEIRSRMNALQGILEHLQPIIEKDIIQQTISLYAASQDHDRMQLISPSGKIIASTELQDIGRSWNNPLASSIMDMLENESLSVHLSKDRRWLESYTPICRAEGQKLRHRICGVLYCRKNLEYHKKIALGDLHQIIFQVGAGSITSAFFLWLLLYLRLTKRAANIIKALEQYRQGNKNIQTAVSGKDELAKVASAISMLFSRVHQDELTIRQSENRFRSLMENIPGAVYRCGLESHGDMLFLSRGIEMICACSASDLIGNADMKYFDLIDHKQQQQVRQSIQRQLMDNKPFTIEYSLNALDGSKHWVLDRGWAMTGENEQANYIEGIIIDITEKKLTETKVHNQQKIFEAVSQAGHDAMIIIDNQDNILFWNNAAEKLYGYRSDEVVGKKKLHRFIIMKKDQKRADKGLDKFRKTGTGVVLNSVMESQSVHRNGKKFPVELAVAGFQIDEAWYAVGSIRDITERKKSENQLKDNLCEKEALLKEIHHRVKNNMQIVASLMFLQAQKIENQEAVKALQDSQNRIKSMSLVHELLYRSEDLSKVFFKEYIETLVLSLREPYSNKNISLQVEAGRIALPVDTAIPCGLIVNELLTNSFKHAFKKKQSGRLKIIFTREEDTYKLVVSDNGCGLPSDYDWQYSSTLGLSLVRTLSAQLDGKLEFKNNNGLHCHLSFRLPGQNK